MQKLLVLMSTKNHTPNTLSTLGVFSSYVKEILVEAHYAKIHSVFPNGFNLSFNGELVYVSYHQEGMLSARGLSIDRDVFNKISSHLKVGMQVRVRGKQWVFYTRPHVFTVNISDISIKNLEIISVTRNEMEQIMFVNRLEALNLLKHSGFSADERLLTILGEIQQSNEIKTENITQLIGAGVGLTPTGDDFLQGLIFMEKTFNKPPTIQTIVQQQLQERSTTDVSISYYQALFSGFSNEPLVLLFQSVKAQDERAFDQAIDYIRNYGMTSGYDLLMGMYMYLKIN